MTFDPSIMETNKNRKDYKQEKFCSLLIPMPLNLMGTKRGWNGEKRREVVNFFQYTCHGKRRGIRREQHIKNTSVQVTCRLP
jgi:hypothetical protein